MGATRPHVSVVCDNTKEYTKLFHVFRCLQCENGFDFHWIWFDATRSEPTSKKVSFLNGPFAFARVDNKNFFSVSSNDFFDNFHMRIKT